MIKANKTVKKETKYIAAFCIALSVIMQMGFLLLKKWDYTVLLGNMLSLVLAVLNFYFMGISVQKAVENDAEDAKKIMRTSQSVRNIFVFVVIAVGVVLPYFNTLAVILPVFFPRIAVSCRPFFDLSHSKEKDVIDR